MIINKDYEEKLNKLEHSLLSLRKVFKEIEESQLEEKEIKAEILKLRHSILRLHSVVNKYKYYAK